MSDQRSSRCLRAAFAASLAHAPVEGSLLTQFADGSVQCAAQAADDPAATTLFEFTDTTDTITTESATVASDINLSDTLYEGVFAKLITENIFFSFNDGNFAAVVFFAIFVGVAFSQHLRGADSTLEASALLRVLKDVEGTLVTLIGWVILLTPLAVLSLIAQAIGKQDNLQESFSNVGYLVLATMVANAAHVLITHFGLLSLVLRQPAWKYLRHITEAQSLALACSSSAATIPVTLKSVINSGYVPARVAKFVVPLGATMNMDGSAIYFPCACVWLAVLNGIDPNIGDYILLVIIATIGSAGTAPVPSASLVLVITAYNTVFNTSGTPAGFEFIFAIDWFMDRFRTVLNVTGDCSVSAMVARWAHMSELEDDLESGEKQLEAPVTPPVTATLPAANATAATPDVQGS